MSQAAKSRSTFLRRLRAGLDRCGVNDARVLVAVSGGADSVALLCGLRELQSPNKLTLRAAHLNHQLRGVAADADAEWVQSLCQRLDVPCDVATAPVASQAEESRRGLEETARETRYTFLRATAEQHRCEVVAVAHTADDQAETVLHHILRGTGLTGLRGMRWSRPLTSTIRLVRPMLAVGRTEVEQYLTERRQEFRSDWTNADRAMTRNRLRHELLPQLERDFNFKVREHLCRLAEQVSAVETVQELAADLLLRAATLDRSANAVRLDCREFASCSREVIRETLVRLWTQQGWPSQAMTFEHWDRLARMLESDTAARVDFPGRISAERRGILFVLEQTS